MSINEAGKAFLRWLAEERGGEVVDPADFLAVAPSLLGESITEDYLKRVFARFKSLGLTKGIGSLGSTLPSNVRLTSDGWQCVEEHGGDMNAFEQSLRGTSTTTQTMNVHQRDAGNVTGFTGGGDVTQTSHVTIMNSPERLRLAADAIEEVLPLYPRVQNRAEIESAVQDVRDAADNGDEDARASAGARLAAAIMTLSGVSTVGRVVFDLLNGSGLFG